MPKRAATYRLSPATFATIDRISAVREGLSATKVIENAVELYGRKVLGRRMADLVKVRLRSSQSSRS